MFSHIFVGADDVAASKKFYDAVLGAIGVPEGKFDPKGRVLIEVPVFNEDVLYYVSAATNPGSVEAPFDRGILFSSVSFESITWIGAAVGVVGAVVCARLAIAPERESRAA